jgi:hypothetical protein
MRPRMGLRSLLLLSAILPAAFGMLWRCGQLDYEALKDWERGGFVRNARICSIEFTLSPEGFQVFRVDSWFRRSQLEEGFRRGSFSLHEIDQRRSHPWDGRDWLAMSSREILSVNWGNPADSVPAPSWQAVKSLWPSLFESLGM